MERALSIAMNTVRQSRTRQFGAVAGFLAVVLAGSESVAEPTLTVTGPEGPVTAGRPFRITCLVQWAGAADAYAVPGVEMDPIDWGRVEFGPVVGMTGNGQNVIEQTIDITPESAGTFDVPEIRTGLQGPEVTPPVPATSESPTHPDRPDVSPTLRSKLPSVTVRRDRTLPWSAGILGALLLSSVAAFRVWRRRALRRAAPGAPPSVSADAGAEEALEAARRHRIEGDYYRYYEQLARAAAPLAGEQPDLAELLQARTRDAGYRGWRPPEDALDGDYRAVEHALSRYRKETRA